MGFYRRQLKEYDHCHGCKALLPRGTVCIVETCPCEETDRAMYCFDCGLQLDPSIGTEKVPYWRYGG